MLDTQNICLFGKRKRNELETIIVKNSKKESKPMTKIVTELFNPDLQRSEYYKCIREGEISGIKPKLIASDILIDEDCQTDDEHIQNCRLPLSSQLLEVIFDENAENY